MTSKIDWYMIDTPYIQQRRGLWRFSKNIGTRLVHSKPNNGAGCGGYVPMYQCIDESPHARARPHTHNKNISTHWYIGTSPVNMRARDVPIMYQSPKIGAR